MSSLGGCASDSSAVIPFQATLLALIAAAAISGCRSTVAPEAIADAQQAVRIKTAFVNDRELGTQAIDVRVSGGVAYLSGRVREAAHIERAASLARAVPGITNVQSTLQVGGTPEPAPPPPPQSLAPDDAVNDEYDPRRSLLAVGASVGWSVPRASALRTRVSVGPLIKLGAPTGLGPVVGFDWFQTDVAPGGTGAAEARIQVRPVMVGAGYTFAASRLAITPSLVAGYAFNSASITETGVARGVPVDVDNSFVWRFGASLWYDVGRRTAVNLSVGQVRTGLDLTVLDGVQLDKRAANGNTFVIHAGLAYVLF